MVAPPVPKVATTGGRGVWVVGSTLVRMSILQLLLHLAVVLGVLLMTVLAVAPLLLEHGGMRSGPPRVV